MKKFISSLDQTSYIITWSIIALAVVIFFAGFYAYKKSGDEPLVLVLSALGPIVLGGLVIIMYFLKPLSVIVDNNSITIERKFKPVVIRFSEIKTVRLLQKGEMKGTIRTFGNGGIFGYTGLYYNKTMGSMTWYCTQRKKYILVEKTNNKKLIITPDNPDDFIQSLRSINPKIGISL